MKIKIVTLQCFHTAKVLDIGKEYKSVKCHICWKYKKVIKQ